MREYIVLVSKDHYNPVGIVRSLGEAGIRPIVVVVKTDPQLVTKSKYVKKKHIVNNIEEGVDLVIKKYTNPNKNEKSVILTGDDVTVMNLDANYDRLKDNFYFYNAGQTGRIREYMNKDKLNTLAIECGFNVAKTWKVKVGDIPADIKFPIMTKAINSFGKEWKDIVYICNSVEELKEAYSKIKSEVILLQEYINKTDELSYEGISIDHGKQCLFTMIFGQEYTIKDKYTPYWNAKNFDDEDFKVKASRMIETIGLEGIFEFEFMKDENGKLWFLEINFRNTVLGWATNVAGMSNVLMWCKSITEDKLIENWYRPIKPGFKAMAECFDYDARVKEGLISKKEWKREYKLVDAKLYKGRNDFRPFFSFMWYKYRHRKSK